MPTEAPSPVALELPTAVFPPPTPPVGPGEGLAPTPSEPTPTLAPGIEPVFTPIQPAPETEVAVATSSPIPTPAVSSIVATSNPDATYRLSAITGVPTELLSVAQAMATEQPDQFTWVDSAEDADVVLTIGSGTPLAQWVYVLAAPFATTADGTTMAAVRDGWRNGSMELGSLVVDANTATTLTAAWGDQTPAQQFTTDPVSHIWAARPSWTIMPFHELRPEFKVLAVDGRSPLGQIYDPAGDPMVVTIGVTGDQEAVAALVAAWDGPTTNRDPDRLTRVAMTGVTALVRATAFYMEQNGILWPGEEVGPILRNANIAHISNEVSFAADCPFPNPVGGTSFCSHDRYFELIQNLGADVIELTGNHLNDFGRNNLLHSLDLYEQAGMVWFGGGRNLADAAEPATFDHNGNRIAFVGCNPVGPGGDWATDSEAGSRPCGPGLAADISRLRAEGYTVIATLQYSEFYQYSPTSQQAADFKALADAGAAVVSGSQGHHAQGFAFHEGSFIHYGLGNLFFDQMDMMGTRQTFVDTLTVYNGRLINVELWTGLIESWARPRLMTPVERQEALTSLFTASGW